MSAASSSDGAGAAHAPTPSFKAGAVLRAVAGTSKAARGVPTGNDFIFHSTTGQFGDAMDGLQARVEPLILGLLKQIHPRTTKPKITAGFGTPPMGPKHVTMAKMTMPTVTGPKLPSGGLTRRALYMTQKHKLKVARNEPIVMRIQ